MIFDKSMALKFKENGQWFLSFCPLNFEVNKCRYKVDISKKVQFWETTGQFELV